MGLCFQLDGAQLLDDRVWKANLSPAEVRMLGTSASIAGDTTVLLLNQMPDFDKAESRLTFDPATAKLLVAGNSDVAIFIASGLADSVKGTPQRAVSYTGGDAAFLSALSKDLHDLGRAILGIVRSSSAGELRFYEKSGRYVESPDNFWTVKPQPRDLSFRITVRGVPESFHDVGPLELKPDQSGYSSFKVATEAQLQAFSYLLGQIPRKR